MHDLPRQKLCELLIKHGLSLCDDVKKLEGLLKDVLRNEHKRETFVLISALREGVAHELRSSKSGIPPAALAAKLARQLCDNLAFDEAAARWGVASWAFALGVEITQPIAATINPFASMNTLKAAPVPSVGVDLAALAVQHRAKAEHDRMKAAEAEATASQMQKEAKANAVLLQKEAKRLAEQTRDFASAARMLEGIDSQWRNAKLYETICGYRDKVTLLDAGIHTLVQQGRVNFLRSRVMELIRLQPKRDDMRRLLEVLPEEPDLQKEFTNSIGMRFVLIQPGEFIMGSKEDRDERPQHMVEITQPFYLGAFPVTQSEYQSVIGKNPSHFTGNSQLPVETVSWRDAIAFCEKASQLPDESQLGASYRLPTEAEWEYACRAGSTGKWSFIGNGFSLVKYAWLGKNSRRCTHPVGEKQANSWGLHDMHGNVLEWCSDRYGVYRSESVFDPQGVETGPDRVLRGGSWYSCAAHCRSASRASAAPTCRDDIIGFRVALSPSVQ